MQDNQKLNIRLISIFIAVSFLATAANCQKKYVLQNDTGKVLSVLYDYASPYYFGTAIDTLAKKKITLEGVKSCISFPKTSGIYMSLSGMVDCWYAIAKGEGKTDEQAALDALDKLGKKIIETFKN